MKICKKCKQAFVPFVIITLDENGNEFHHEHKEHSRCPLCGGEFISNSIEGENK